MCNRVSIVQFLYYHCNLISSRCESAVREATCAYINIPQSSKSLTYISIYSTHSSIPQTTVLPNPHLPLTPPLTTRNRRPRNNQLTNRLTLSYLGITIPYQANLNTAHRRAKAAVTLAFFPPVIEDVRLRHHAENVRGCQSVDNSCTSENAEVGDSA